MLGRCIRMIVFCFYYLTTLTVNSCRGTEVQLKERDQLGSEYMKSNHSVYEEVTAKLRQMLGDLKWKRVLVYTAGESVLLNFVTDELSRHGVRFAHLSRTSERACTRCLQEERMSPPVPAALDDITSNDRVKLLLTPKIDTGASANTTWITVTVEADRDFVSFWYPNMSTKCTRERQQLITTSLRPNWDVYSIEKTSAAQTPAWSGFTNSDNASRHKLMSEHRTLRVGFKEWFPSATKRKINGTVVYSGFSVELLSILGARLNLSIEYTEYEDEEWGTLVNGTWTGLLAILKNKKIDILVPPYTNLKDRQDHFDFTYPVRFDSQVMAVYNTTTSEQSIWQLGVNLISWRILVLTLLSLFTTAITLAMTQHLLHTDRKKQSMVQICETIICKTWYLIGSLLKQGEDGLQPCSNRTTLAAWCLFCLIICSSLSAALIASLSASAPRKPLTSLEQLVNQRTYKWGMVAGGYVAVFAQAAEGDNALRRLWDGIEEFRVNDPDVVHSSRDIHLQKVKLGYYVYLSDAIILKRVLAENCNLHSFLIPLLDQQTSFILPKGSPFTDMLSHQILALHENGVIKYLAQRWLSPRNKCSKKRTLGNQLDLETVKIVFTLLLWGIAIALFFLFLEVASSYIQSKKRTRKPKMKQTSHP